MPRSIAIRTSSSMPSVGDRITPGVRRLAHEALTLGIGCAAAVGLTLALFLLAPAELRDGVVSAFLGFDQPIRSSPAHPPMPQ